MIKQIPLNEENCQQREAIFAQPSSIYKSKLNPLTYLSTAMEKSENIGVLIASVMGLLKKKKKTSPGILTT